MDLHEREQMTYIFITHDLKLVRHMADRVCVMYDGKIMEISSSKDFFSEPAHPYSNVLYNSMLSYNFRERLNLVKLAENCEESDVAKKENIKNEGCVYFKKCYASKEICGVSKPPLKELGRNRTVSCFFPFTHRGL